MTIDEKFMNKRARLFIHQTMCLKIVEKKKLLVHHKKVAKWLFNTIKKIQKQPPEILYKKTAFLKTLQYSQDDHETPASESLFNSEHCKIF